jgi:hypothetical protein
MTALMDRVSVEKSVLSENDRIAARLRRSFTAAGTLCLNERKVGNDWVVQYGGIRDSR